MTVFCHCYTCNDNMICKFMKFYSCTVFKTQTLEESKQLESNVSSHSYNSSIKTTLLHTILLLLLLNTLAHRSISFRIRSQSHNRLDVRRAGGRLERNKARKHIHTNVSTNEKLKSCSGPEFNARKLSIHISCVTFFLFSIFFFLDCSVAVLAQSFCIMYYIMF